MTKAFGKNKMVGLCYKKRPSHFGSLVLASHAIHYAKALTSIYTHTHTHIRTRTHNTLTYKASNLCPLVLVCMWSS